MKTFLFYTLLSSTVFAQNNFQKLENFLFHKPDPGMTTEAFVFWHDGKVVYDKYEKGDEETLHLLWSMSKSISSFLLGIAQDKGYLKISDPLIKYYKTEIDKMPKDQKLHYSKLKVDHFLHMASGLDWNEFYEADPFNSHVVNMLYAKTLGDVASYVLQTPARYAPGERFYYSSGDTNVFMDVLKKSLPKEQQSTFPWDWFFNPMGIEAIFEMDGSGTFIGSSYAYMKTKDLLKLGLLIMNKGEYEGKRIVSEDYINYAINLSPYQKERCLEDSYMTYGAQIWLNHKCDDGRVPFKDVPDDLVMFLGHGGQSVFVIPSQKIIAVRIARDVHKALKKRKYTLLLMESLGIKELEK